MSLPAARAGRHTVAAQASAFPGLRSSTPYQRSGAPGLPSGGRAAGHKQPRFTRGVKRHARRASPASVQRVRSRRAVVVPGRGKGLRRRQSVRFRGRHRLPRALFCQAPFSAPGPPACLRGGAGGCGQARCTRGVKRSSRRAGPAPACPGQTGGRNTRERERACPP